ncbi:MAG TPA: heliorhodopsin HeR [Candidatus Dojkabacteria bacterium]|nr:heliorhodopsin HeR [Candidatus Dojkabacteria bacterium]HOZ44827.1 heliorhodopsin HeR [Candidatus Dojkabacteria bacterium]
MENKLKGLNRFNLIMGGLHFIQAIAVLLLSDPERGVVTVTLSFLKFDQTISKLLPASEQLFTINLAWLVALFFFLSSIAHLFIATVYREKYESDLMKGINKVRWFEYALSASVMMVAISLLSGIYDLSSLIMIFFLDAIMNLTGLAMEVHNQGEKKIKWLDFVIGCIAGIIPWIVFGIYVYGARQFGGGDIPTFVYWIYVSIFIFFNSFAINMFLQYKKIGAWKNYLYGERAYIILSLVAKTLLAWQVFGGTLRP